jgi:hypothetical protein
MVHEEQTSIMLKQQTTSKKHGCETKREITPKEGLKVNKGLYCYNISIIPPLLIR